MVGSWGHAAGRCCFRACPWVASLGVGSVRRPLTFLSIQSEGAGECGRVSRTGHLTTDSSPEGWDSSSNHRLQARTLLFLSFLVCYRLVFRGLKSVPRKHVCSREWSHTWPMAGSPFGGPHLACSKWGYGVSPYCAVAAESAGRELSGAGLKVAVIPSRQLPTSGSSWF